MSERTHTSPDGKTRFIVLVQLSHVDVGLFRRDYAGITVFREIRERVSFNLFDPTTWFRERFVRRGDAATIVVGFAFLDNNNNDLSVILNLNRTNQPGHFGLSALFVNIGTQPDNLGNDARNVRRVHLEYSLPWETTRRTLNQT